jgi:hypothetical protein
VRLALPALVTFLKQLLSIALHGDWIPVFPTGMTILCLRIKGLSIRTNLPWAIGIIACPGCVARDGHVNHRKEQAAGTAVQQIEMRFDKYADPEVE